MKKVYNLIVIFLFMGMLISCGTLNKGISTNLEEKTLNSLYSEVEKDVIFMRDTMHKKACGFFHFVTEEEWTNSCNELIEDLNSKYMSNETIYYRINELLAKVRNSHTNINPGFEVNLKYFPIGIGKIQNDFRVGIIEKEYEKLIGAKLLKINEYTIEEVRDKYMKIESCETEKHIEEKVFNQYPLEQTALEYLEVVDGESANFTFELENGEIETIIIKSGDIENYEFVKIGDKLLNYPPTSLRNVPEGQSEYYWYNIDEENKAAYFQYNTCADSTITNRQFNENFLNTSSMPVFSEFGDEMIEFMKNNDNKFDKFIIDLRNNGGGNSQLLNSWIVKNKEYLSSKDIRVLIGPATASAALKAVEDLLNNFNITIYGEETSGPVGGFTEVAMYKSPNTDSVFFYSVSETGNSSLIERADDEFRGIIPDVFVQTSYEEFINGIDAVYNKALE
ncbi:S41 family peptidase [Clostridium sp.]|uniref:S41 family peptidase n=1 Tax=Clostridium sp. TaxID=1506 RepID=UPI001B671CFA|nr:S41 family peptidase [Clostridium sp.]MBP3915728.1 hypothetical protein [Clostridium sp.]